MTASLTPPSTEAKHQLDDYLPPILIQDSFGAEEWRLLEELCESDSTHFELIRKLLETERQYQLASSRSGILKDLAECFDPISQAAS